MLRRLMVEGCPLDGIDGSGRTALMIAVESSRQEFVEALIANGANLEIERRWEGTAAAIAVKRGNKLALRALIEAGCDIDRKDELGGTLLLSSVRRDCAQSVELLLGAGCLLDCWSDVEKRSVPQWCLTMVEAESESRLLGSEVASTRKSGNALRM